MNTEAEEALLQVDALHGTGEANGSSAADDFPTAQPVPGKVGKAFPVRLLVRIAACAAVLVLLFLFGRCLFAGKPLNRIETGWKNSIRAAGASDLGTSLSAVAETGSLAVSTDLSKFGSLLGADLPGSLELCGFSSLKAKKTALTLAARLAGEPVLDATLNLTADEITASCAALFGRTNYGISFRNMAKNLPKSAADPAQLTPYALPEELYAFLLKQNEGLYASFAKLAEDAGDIAEDARQVLRKSINKNAAFTKSREKLDVGEALIQTAAVNAVLDSRALASVIEDTLRWARSSKELRAFLSECTGSYACLLEAAGIDPGELSLSFYESISEVLSDPEGLRDALENVRLSGTFYISAARKQLVRADLSLKTAEGKYALSLCGGPDWKHADYASVSLKLPDGSKTGISLNIQENSSENYRSQLWVKRDRDTLLSAAVSWKKKSGEFELTAGDRFALTGTVTRKNRVTTADFRQLTLEALTVKDLGITVTVSESVKFPAIAKYTDLLTIRKEEDIRQLIDDVSEAAAELAELIKDAM